MRFVLDQNLTNWLNHPPYEIGCMVEIFLWFSFIDGLHREIKIYSMQANVYIEIVRPIDSISTGHAIQSMQNKPIYNKFL